MEKFVAGVVHGGSYSSAIVEALERYKDREAFVMGERRISFAEAAGQISQIKQLLASLGVGHHGQVAVLSKNAPEVWLTQAAAFLLGARYSGLHPMGSLDDWAFVCDDAEVEVLVVHPSYAEAALKLKERCKALRHLLVLGEAEAGENMLELMQQFEPVRLDAGPATSTDIAWLQYTGGTTGKPKGVMVSHRAMLEMARVPLGYCHDISRSHRLRTRG
jgi:fatty-acyl-CoA synthase